MAEQVKDGVPFDINVVGDESGESWVGKFRAKEKVSFQDQMNADRYRRELLGPNGHEADPEVQGQALMVSELAVRLTDSPKWWQEMKGGLGLSDINVLTAVYTEVVRIRKEFIERVQKKGADAKAQLQAGTDK